MLFLASQIMNYKGEYDAAVTYRKGNMVLNQNDLYLCLQDNTGVSLSNEANWALFGEASLIDDTDPTSLTTTYSAAAIEGKLGGQAGAVALEDWEEGGGEAVELIDDAPPAEVSDVYVSDLDKSSLVLNWTESTSSDSKDYLIYNGSTLVAAVPATASKLQPLKLQVTGLTPATSYLFTVKSRDQSNNESAGIVVPVRTFGNYSILLNGTTDNIKLPSLAFDTVELTCQANPGPTGITYTYIDARPGISTSYFAINGNGNIQYGPVWTKILVNGSIPNDLNSVKSSRMTLTISLSSPSTDDINIFSDYQGHSNMPGKVYFVKILQGGTVVASYNFTEKFDGSSVIDGSGNGHTAALNGGTWVSVS